MTLNLQLPERLSLKPVITVVGVGGAGGNAVNNMIAADLGGINFAVANTDAQALEGALAERRIQLGPSITQGQGAGAYPEVGRAAADESMEEILDHLQGSHMVFIAAGMGGGTGTGAAPIIARLAKEQGILTVGVVTKPFTFEGPHRMRIAEAGLKEMQKYVDTLIVIPNQNLFRIADRNTTFLDAFKLADNVLHSGVRGITDLIVMPGLINLDFSDVRSIMSEMGKAMMGTGEGTGDNRAVQAAEAAIANPLLDNVSMRGARGVLINITGGPDLTLFEVDEAANRIREEVDPEANIIFGSAFDQNMSGKIRVSVVATGIDHAETSRAAEAPAQYRAAAYVAPQEPAVTGFDAMLQDAATDPNRFVAPEPLEPRETPHFSVRDDLSEPITPRTETVRDVASATRYQAPTSAIVGAPVISEKGKSSLFSNLFGAKKEEDELEAPTALENGLPEVPAAAAPRPRVAAPKEPAKDQGFFEEDLDIPAYLRKKNVN